MLGLRLFLSTGMVCMLAATGYAHDLKVMPERASMKRGETAVISLSWGHKLPLDQPIDASALARYELESPSGTRIPMKSSGSSMQTNEQSLEEVGVYQAIASRRPSTYTVVRGKDGQHHHHRGTKTSVKPEDGEIEYAALSRQYAKTLIVSGERNTQRLDPQGLPLEITPIEAPTDWRADRKLHFQVLFQGEPLPREELVVTVLHVQPTADAESDTDTDAGGFKNPTLLTDEWGVVTVDSVPPGTWVLRQRVKKPVTDEAVLEQYDYESFTSTLILDVLP